MCRVGAAWQEADGVAGYSIALGQQRSRWYFKEPSNNFKQKTFVENSLTNPALVSGIIPQV